MMSSTPVFGCMLCVMTYFRIESLEQSDSKWFETKLQNVEAHEK